MQIRNIIRAMLSAFALISFTTSIQAADAPVKREMRSAWVATVWNLDWPPSKISETGNASQIKKQQDAMTALLDSLAVNNMNAVNFQVRSRSDAMYKSSYEPWSSDLVSTRGLDPGWDPLEWVVAECHKRGLECHAWVNPYRYESQVNQWNGTPKCYRETNPEWLLDVNGASILNPGLQEVTDQIVKVIREIVQNYDIDGVLFDDYFYLSGTPTDNSGDGKQYNAYVAAGGTLSHGDWRRENVNRMVDAVYKMIQEEKPWVRFGVSPAGVACSNGAVAAKYGITPSPGSDWQYNDIFSDPVAWIYNHSLDYISPQIYWTIGHTTNYAEVAPWWSEVAAKFNRHFYSSHSISSLSSKDAGYTAVAQALSQREQTIIASTKASGPNSGSYEEFANQIRLNRTSTKNDAPGSIFYSCKYLYKSSPKFAHYLKTTVFNTPALVPAITWKPGYNPGPITNLSRNGAVLTWNGHENVRYTVYAVPESMPVINFNCEAEYLLGTAYATTFTIPNHRLSGYTYAVCVLDRYGNEYSPIFIGKPAQTMPAPVLTYPANNANVEAPFSFTWNAVENASSYIIEIAKDQAFTQMSHTRLCNTTSCSTYEFEGLALDQKQYWRVRACGNGYSDGISEVRAFTPNRPYITAPENGATGITLTPTISWNVSGREMTVEISKSSDFAENYIIYTTTTTASSITLPAGTLGSYTTYHVRLRYVKDGETLYSEPISFTTMEIIPSAPVIYFPKDGGEFRSEDYIIATPSAGTTKVRIEVSASEVFGRQIAFEDCPTGQWQMSTKAGELKISSKNLVSGTKYYIRTRASYSTIDGDQKTEWSPVISATYMGEGSGIEQINDDNFSASIIKGNNPQLSIVANGCITVKATAVTGVQLGTLYDGEIAGSQLIDLSTLGHGLFIITIDMPGGSHTIKASL